MAKNKKHIDDLFKDNLQGSQLPLDGSEWNRLFDDLHPKKKKRFAWWWFGIGILLVSAAGFVYHTLNSSSSASLPLVDSSATVEENIENRADRIIDQNVQQQKENRDDTRTDLISKDLEKEEEIIDKNSGQKLNDQANSKSTTTGGENVDQKSNRTTKPLQKSSNKPVDVVNPGNNSGIVRIAAKPFIEIPWRINPFGAPLLTMSDHLDQAPLLYAYNMADLIDTLDPIQKFVNPYIGLSIGGSQMNQNLTSGIENYTRLRTSNESKSFLPNFGFDIGAGYKGLEIASGIKYLEKGQQSNPNYTYEKYDSIRRVDGQGNVSYLRWNFRDTTVNGVPSPRYRYVSVPLTIGKQLVSNDKFDLAFGITSNIQFLAGGAGTILNNDLTLKNVQRLDGINRLSLTYGGYITVGYALNDRMKFKLLTRFDADALDMMKHTDISQRMNGVGADLSLQFKLKK